MKRLVVIMVALFSGVSFTHSHDLPGWPGYDARVIADYSSTVEIKIKGLVCTSCAIGVKKLFGINVRGIHLDIKNQIATVKLIDSTIPIDKEKVKKAIIDAGYEVTWIKIRKVAIA